jgi:hypothetical protein
VIKSKEETFKNVYVFELTHSHIHFSSLEGLVKNFKIFSAVVRQQVQVALKNTAAGDNIVISVTITGGIEVNVSDITITGFQKVISVIDISMYTHINNRYSYLLIHKFHFYIFYMCRKKVYC